MKQNLLSFLCVLLVILMIPTKINAHGGRLDSQNCHRDYETGYYHCHAASVATDWSDYDRQSYAFRSKQSPYSDSRVGYYTGIMVEATDVDHIVSLHDAHVSGAVYWSGSKKRQFANDAANHAPSLPKLNRKKGNLTPREFIKSMEQRDALYSFYSRDRKCEYLKRYVYIKKKYELSFQNNDLDYINRTLADCRAISELAHSSEH